MAKLTAVQRKALPKSDFAMPSKAPGPGSFPIPDKAHAVAAKSKERFASPADRKVIDKKANAMLGKGKLCPKCGKLMAGCKCMKKGGKK